MFLPVPVCGGACDALEGDTDACVPHCDDPNQEASVSASGTGGVNVWEAPGTGGRSVLHHLGRRHLRSETEVSLPSKR